MPGITLDPADAAELAKTLAFLADWLSGSQKQALADSFATFVGRDAGEVAKELRAIYTAPTAEAAFDALAAFAASPWGTKYPQAVRVWEQAWDAFTPFLAFSPAVRKLLYTTNAIESLNYQLRKVTKALGHFPTDDAVVKLLWLAIINIEDKRARERLARRQHTGKRSDQAARLVEGQRVMGWREAPQRARHCLPRAPKITAQKYNSKMFTHLSLQARWDMQIGVPVLRASYRRRTLLAGSC